MPRWWWRDTWLINTVAYTCRKHSLSACSETARHVPCLSVSLPVSLCICLSVCGWFLLAMTDRRQTLRCCIWQPATLATRCRLMRSNIKLITNCAVDHRPSVSSTLLVYSWNIFQCTASVHRRGRNMRTAPRSRGIASSQKKKKKKRKKIFAQTEVRCVGAHLLWSALSRRRLNPIKPAYNPSRLDGRLR